MVVPAVLVGRASPSRAEAPLATDAVGPTRPKLSTSGTERGGGRTGCAPCGNDTGGSVSWWARGTCAAGMSIGMAAVPIVLVAVPSLTVQTAVRLGLAPKLVGLSLGVVNVTRSSTAW